MKIIIEDDKKIVIHQRMLLSIFIILVSITLKLNAKDNLEVYNAYGNNHQIIIQGRTLKKRDFKIVNESDGWFKNLYRRVRQLQSNELKEKKVVATIQDEKYTTKSDHEGYFEFDIYLKKPFDIENKKINLNIDGNSDTHSYNAMIIEPKKLVGIISDFDDTIIVSDVTNKFKLVTNILFKNYKQRKLVPNILEKFKKILVQNPINSPCTLFILTGSPQQFFTPVEKFLSYHHFPNRVLILKKAHGENSEPIIDQFAYKFQKIEQLIRLYPEIEWVLFGDSGEKDRKVYSEISIKYPNKIKTFYIRDVESGEIKKFKMVRQRG